MLAELRHWVEDFARKQYPAYMARLRPCWPNHPEAVWELSTLMAEWERGWSTLFATLDGLEEADLGRTVTIRGEPHSARQALMRGMTPVAYHTGQIVYLVRLIRPESDWLTIPPGQSRDVPGAYRRP